MVQLQPFYHKTISTQTWHQKSTPEPATLTEGFRHYPQSLQKNSGIIPQIMLRPPPCLPSETQIMKDTRPITNRRLKDNNNINNRFETNYAEKDYSNTNFDKWLLNCFKLLLWFMNIGQYDIT
jgi:hypothetical protein